MIYKRGETYWYKFMWRGELIRESAKVSNPRTARQIEAAHKTSLAKGEVGIRERKPAPTLSQFAEKDFKPFVTSTFKAKAKTKRYYENGIRALLEYAPLADARMDTISSEKVAGYVAKRQEAKLEVSSINRELQVLRRMFYLATEWGKVEKALPKVRMLPGERHRDRVLTPDEEARYLKAATAIGNGIIEDYRRALDGIRATKRGEQPIEPKDPFLLRDVATVLIDCGVRPEECLRLEWASVRDGGIEVQHGKTEAARRRIPLSKRAELLLEARRESAKTAWVFPAATKSGHIEPCSVKRQHAAACKESKVEPFPLYSFRHTCLTRWAPNMDPWTLSYLGRTPRHGDYSPIRASAGRNDT